MAVNLTSFLPTKVRLRRFDLGGVSLLQHVQNIKVYESMCTPYIKCDVTVIDNKGILAALTEDYGTLANLPVRFAFDDGETIYERKEQRVFSVDSQPAQEAKRAQVYNVTTIGESYFKDRSNLVQQSFKNTPATQAAQAIHNRFLGGDAPLNILRQSLGMIAKDTIGSFPVSNFKPFKAIEDVLRTATYNIAANPTVYFRDALSYQLGPLQSFFQQAQAEVEVIERATWGVTVHDMFEAAHYSVVSAAVLVDKADRDSGTGGGARVGNLAAAAYQSENVFDLAQGILTKDIPAKALDFASLLPGFGQSIGRAGGMMNVLLQNSLRRDPQHDPSIKRTQEAQFLASVSDATKYLVKVPIRAGLKMTPGKGVNARLLAPAGAEDRARPVGGLMIVADVVHDCYFDEREAQAFSTFRGVKVNDVR